MNDSYFERKLCRQLIRNAHGKVLITGLGIKYAPTVAKNPAVESVTILKKPRRALTSFYRHAITQLNVILADAETWQAPYGMVRYDLARYLFYWHPSKAFQDMCKTATKRNTRRGSMWTTKQAARIVKLRTR